MGKKQNNNSSLFTFRRYKKKEGEIIKFLNKKKKR